MSHDYNVCVDGVHIPDDVVKKAVFLYMTRDMQAAQAQAAAEPVAWFIDVTTNGKSTGDYQVAAREHWGDMAICIPLYTAPPAAMRLALSMLHYEQGRMASAIAALKKELGE